VQALPLLLPAGVTPAELEVYVKDLIVASHSNRVAGLSHSANSVISERPGSEAAKIDDTDPED